VGGSNNSLGSIASISKMREMGKKKKEEQDTGKKTKEKGATDIWHRERDGRKDT
jgi:hypothetical protein